MDWPAVELCRNLYGSRAQPATNHLVGRPRHPMGSTHCCRTPRGYQRAPQFCPRHLSKERVPTQLGAPQDQRGSYIQRSRSPWSQTTHYATRHRRIWYLLCWWHHLLAPLPASIQAPGNILYGRPWPWLWNEVSTWDSQSSIHLACQDSPLQPTSTTTYSISTLPKPRGLAIVLRMWSLGHTRPSSYAENPKQCGAHVPTDWRMDGLYRWNILSPGFLQGRDPWSPSGHCARAVAIRHAGIQWWIRSVASYATSRTRPSTTLLARRTWSWSGLATSSLLWPHGHSSHNRRSETALHRPATPLEKACTHGDEETRISRAMLTGSPRIPSYYPASAPKFRGTMDTRPICLKTDGRLVAVPMRSLLHVAARTTLSPEACSRKLLPWAPLPERCNLSQLQTILLDNSTSSTASCLRAKTDRDQYLLPRPDRAQLHGQLWSSTPSTSPRRYQPSGLFTDWGTLLAARHPSRRHLQTATTRATRTTQSLEESIGPYPTDDAQANEVFEETTEAVAQWFEDFQACGCDPRKAPSLDNVWLNVAEELAISDHEHAAFLLMHWGEHYLQPLLETWLDGQAEKLVEDSFASITQEFPRSRRQTRIQTLVRLLANPNAAQARRPHRPVRRGAANQRERQEAREEIHSLYQTQEEWQENLRQAEWSTTPTEKDVPTINEVAVRPHFLVVHLFSGRRRPGDIHEHLQSWASRAGCTMTVLSLDTANSGWYGDLNFESATWGRLTELYEGGHIAATISGSPCETFSSARAQPPPQELLDQGVTWPRPLRSFTRLFGLDHLTMRELRQTRMGSAFFLQTALALVYQLTFGGCGISEHPWIPTDPSFPSIWRTAILQLIAKHPRACLHRVEQWRWGATVRKPTGLLAIRLQEFNKSMYGRMHHTATPPTQVAIGRDCKTGRFKTMEHKEYPKRFCEAMAGTICDQLERDLRLGKCRNAPVSADLFAWLKEAANALEQQKLAGPLPDFQG